MSQNDYTKIGASAPQAAGESPMLDAALVLARAGYPVFPLNGKKPMEAGGFHTATTDEPTIRAWWDRWPDANIGVPTGHHTDAVTGQPNAHPFDVLDVDVRSGGYDSLAVLTDQYGDLPGTVRQTTGTGGTHYFFASNGVVRNSAGTLGPGLDVRGTGGYVVVAPSMHPEAGQPYAWGEECGLLDCTPAEMTDWLKERIDAGQRRGDRTPGARIPQGQRETALMELGGAMRRRGATESEILAAFQTVNLERCDPPLDDADLIRMAGSVCRYDPANRLLTLPLTDIGNGERFAYVNKGRALWCEELRQWFWWDDTRWNALATRRIHRMAKDTIRSVLIHAVAMPADSPTRGALIDFARRSESERAVNAMINLAKTELEVSAAEFDTDPWLLNCLNGTIDLRTGTLRPHDPDDLITKLAPVDYDPEATLPELDTFIETITSGNEEVASFLQRAVGYSATGDTREDKLFMVLGPSRTGKSTFIEAIKATLGDYAETANFDTFIKKRNESSIREDIARLAGKRFVSSVEVDDGKALAAAVVKQMTGGDTVAARKLYQGTFSFTPQAKLWLVANHAPKISKEDEAMWERVLRLPFDNVIPAEKRDGSLKARLKDPNQAGSAILAWIVKGCLKWQIEGLCVPAVVMSATAAYREEMDPLKDFIEECCVMGEQEIVSVGGLRHGYETWASLNGERYPLNRTKFNESIRAMGCTRKKGRGGAWVWQGIRCRSVGQDGEQQSQFERMTSDEEGDQ